jgi:hypothetical protein
VDGDERRDAEQESRSFAEIDARLQSIPSRTSGARSMSTDLEIARSVAPRPIADVAAALGLAPEELRAYGTDIAKVSPAVLQTPRRRAGEG